jgi:xanthine dehydrogenase accessory factor
MRDRPEERLRLAAAELSAGRPVVRAVIVKTWGSTPREVGADMLIDSSGALKGTIGGGCGEAEVYELARELLSPDPPAQGYLCHVDLTENPDDGGDKVCGGRFDVLLGRLDPRRHGELVASALTLLEMGEELCWQTTTDHHRPGSWKNGALEPQTVSARLSLSTKPADAPHWGLDEQGDHQFSEPLGQSPRLVIVGAGHIARPLCRMAAEVGYRVAVLDDRPEYATAEMFPDAQDVVAGDYERQLPGLAGHPRTSVVLVTRGHKHDQDCLRLMAGRPLDYLGMIGSQRRIDAVYADLVKEGVDPEALRAVHAPVGLEIGARTPAEIAVSILAQMIKVRRRIGPQRLAPDRLRHQRSIDAKEARPLPPKKN